MIKLSTDQQYKTIMHKIVAVIYLASSALAIGVYPSYGGGYGLGLGGQGFGGQGFGGQGLGGQGFGGQGFGGQGLGGQGFGGQGFGGQGFGGQGFGGQGFGGQGYGQEGHQDYHAYPKYKFDYSVHDPHTHDFKAQAETRDGDVVKGFYTLKEADGTTREVHYTADDHNGFNAVVHRKGEAYHPQVYGYNRY